MSSSVFSLDAFLLLKGPDLINYVEPFLASNNSVIPEKSVLDLLLIVDQLSTEHMVYALEIGARIAPQKYANTAIACLSHSDASVSCVAARMLEQLPPDLAPENFLSVISRVPVVDIYSTHFRTGQRIKVGTNREFLVSLIKKFESNSYRR